MIPLQHCSHYMPGHKVGKEHKFRCLKVRGDNYSEISKAWGTKRTRQQAWKECIDAVDAHPPCK